MSKANILVVDDEPAIRSFLVRVLQRGGYSVQDARNGQEALEYLGRAPFDLLLTDIKMDRIDGVTLVSEAHHRYPDMAVILLTGHATVASAVIALRQRAYDYLLKPVKNEDILAAVASALRERTRQQRRDRLEYLADQMLDIMQPEERAPVPATSPDIACWGLRINPVNYTAILHNKPLPLTPTEFRLLVTFIRAPDAVIDYVRLVQAACGYTCERHEAQEIIGTHIRNLRQKLRVTAGQPLYIEAVRGVGYRLLTTVTSAG